MHACRQILTHRKFKKQLNKILKNKKMHWGLTFTHKATKNRTKSWYFCLCFVFVTFTLGQTAVWFIGMVITKECSPENYIPCLLHLPLRPRHKEVTLDSRNPKTWHTGQTVHKKRTVTFNREDHLLGTTLVPSRNDNLSEGPLCRTGAEDLTRIHTSCSLPLFYDYLKITFISVSQR